ncbi:hypothetical protein ABOM_005437 [Aspergillus bombycis]|uniref:Uncharacterized protein n=1 Tax=Aspergillus bombycis TaxID=109264 RepID=A0A1F8A319_9EURO|nr:hypothetical protein ABOM_005437 [Aspergillus bombycis]OGM45718.1 hypothetical protein ABOM_005437 [Aspergillus bombycis]
MCFDLLAEIILDIFELIALIFRILQKLLRLPFAFWRTLVEWNQSVRRKIRHLLMPRIDADGDIYNPPIPNHVNGTPNPTAGTIPSFVVTHYDDDGGGLHGTERSVEESLAASIDQPVTAERQQSEQGPQEQGPRQPRPQRQQLGQQPSGQQQPEPLGHELQQLGPQQQSSELPPREPMPRERVLPEQDSGEPSERLQLVSFDDVVHLMASASGTMPGSGQPEGNPHPIHFGPNGIQPRQYVSPRLPGSYPEPLPDQLTQGRVTIMPGTFPAEPEDEGREH